jgi:hypothetical protein
VNSIHLGFIFASMVECYIVNFELNIAGIRPTLDAAHPLGGTGEPDDIAWGAVYPASD